MNKENNVVEKQFRVELTKKEIRLLDMLAEKNIRSAKGEVAHIIKSYLHKNADLLLPKKEDE
jgi:uncharacterized protein YehS (DUF1456 family)